MKWMWLSVQILLGLLLIGATFVYFVNRQVYLQTNSRAKDSITEIRVEEPPRVGIVFGASVSANGEPSPALEDRITTAVELYRAGRVKKILMSGDNRAENYNEPKAMKDAAVKLGVPESDIVQDAAGLRTFDTCYRARDIFNVSRAVLVTQEFHLNRAIYLCESVGIDSIGINADRRQYPNEAKNWWNIRESFAVTAAWIDVNLIAQMPAGGKKEPLQ